MKTRSWAPWSVLAFLVGWGRAVQFGFGSVKRQHR
jgi:hypothetical protein